MIKSKIKNLLLATFFFVALAAFAHDEHNKMNQKKDSVTQTVSVKTVVDSSFQDETNEHMEIHSISTFPNLHPLVVHFPIVLIIIATAFQLLSFFVYRNEFSFATVILLTLGAISTWLASTIFHAHPEALVGKASEIFETHELMAEFTKWLSTIAIVLKLFSHFFLKRKWWTEALVALLLITSTVTVSIAGHHGAMLVYMEGIGPLGKHLEPHHD